jgi:catechol 2,3-dioxygenase-like lactoylglutathione lyase family enzyme
MGIDHSAMSVGNVTESEHFYCRRGLSAAKAMLNHGAAQVALDGLDSVEVDVVPMNPGLKPPHIEILGYRCPIGRAISDLAANDIAATRILWQSDDNALVRDPDGHIHQLSR